MMCGSRIYPYLPHGKSLEILIGRSFKGKYEAKLEIPEKWGIETQKNFLGEGVCVFSGTTQLVFK